MSKHPLSSYERTLAVHRNPSKTQCEWDEKEAIIYVQYVEMVQSSVQCGKLKCDIEKGGKKERRGYILNKDDSLDSDLDTVQCTVYTCLI